MYVSLQDDILLEVEDLYYLLLEFPKTVNEDTASAIFNKKKRRLTLTVEALCLNREANVDHRRN